MGNITIGNYENPEAVGYRGWISGDDWIVFVKLDGTASLFELGDDGGVK